ncbi:MAG: glycosyltransferase family 2 protein [Treponema sp.]|nr:glycosyltransferase family 2 protein [Treponema sp.]
MISTPLVSVIIPCYNASKYVEKAVRSIMEQTYPNLEILIANDCSTDNTLEILELLSKEDSRIKIINNEQNLKIVKTLNKLIEIATGKYIARMDADDISLPDRIEKQVLFLEKNPEYAMCGTNAWHIDDNGNIIGKTDLPLTPEKNKYFLKYYSTFYHPTIMIRSEVYKNNLYSEDYLYAEDYELWCRLIFKNDIKCANLKEKLFKYRISASQTCNLHSNDQSVVINKIFQRYNIVSQRMLVHHENIFIIDGCYNKNEIYYVKELLVELYSEKLIYSYLPYTKVFLHIIKKYPKIKIFSFLLTKSFIKTFLYYIYKKICLRVSVLKAN